MTNKSKILYARFERATFRTFYEFLLFGNFHMREITRKRMRYHCANRASLQN